MRTHRATARVGSTLGLVAIVSAVVACGSSGHGHAGATTEDGGATDAQDATYADSNGKQDTVDDGGGDATNDDVGDPASNADSATGFVNVTDADGARDMGAVEALRWLGRVDTANAAGPRFAWSGTGFSARFTGSALSVRLDNTAPIVFKAVVDGVAAPLFTASAGPASYVIASGLAAGDHTVSLYRQTEGVFGDTQLLGLVAEGGALLDPPPAPARLVEAVGASVTCGYGNLGASPCSFTIETESHWDTYAAIAARAVGADLDVVAISGRGVYRNGDGTTEGTMPKLYDRIFPDRAVPAWDFHKTPDVVIINLGRNDFGVGDPGVAFRDAYTAFARTLRARHPAALIIGTTGPNLGDVNHALQLAYVQSAVAVRHGEGDDNIEIVDWPEMTADEIGCDFHPTAAKHQRMADQVVAVVRAKLGW
jgi:lysophospholipase L1-like esterase